MDYIISLDMTSSKSYEDEIFRPQLLDYDYKDCVDALLWLAEPLTKELEETLASFGYRKGKNLVDFYEIIYGSDTHWPKEDSRDSFHRGKTGKRDIQFMEYLEWKYGCNFVTAVHRDKFVVSTGTSYVITTQKEIFPILDRCHCLPSDEDGIFDFGCGKGGAMVSFWDYGFRNIGGVEYEPGIYDVLMDNMEKLQAKNYVGLECIQRDAAHVKTELDKYNYFYFFGPFYDDTLSKVISNIAESVQRTRRKIHIIRTYPGQARFFATLMEPYPDFKLVNQFTVAMKRKVVSIWENMM